MPASRLIAYLEDNGVRYASLTHDPAYSAQEAAAAAHIPGKCFAKTVLVRVDGRLVLTVLPAMEHVHLRQLQRALGARRAELADEAEFAPTFPDCEPGAVPPFGGLYGLETFVNPRLEEDESIAFRSGTHNELIIMRYSDYRRLSAPVPLRF